MVRIKKNPKSLPKNCWSSVKDLLGFLGKKTVYTLGVLLGADIIFLDFASEWPELFPRKLYDHIEQYGRSGYGYFNQKESLKMKKLFSQPGKLWSENEFILIYFYLINALFLYGILYLISDKFLHIPNAVFVF